MLKAIGNRIRELRLQQGEQSREAFAARCGLDAELLEGIEGGNVDVSISMITAIAVNLKIEVATMLEGIA
jgi:transcriptional regulator with XRE-family HTH domain